MYILSTKKLSLCRKHTCHIPGAAGTALPMVPRYFWGATSLSQVSSSLLLLVPESCLSSTEKSWGLNETVAWNSPRHACHTPSAPFLRAIVASFPWRRKDRCSHLCGQHDFLTASTEAFHVLCALALPAPTYLYPLFLWPDFLHFRLILKYINPNVIISIYCIQNLC